MKTAFNNNTTDNVAGFWSSVLLAIMTVITLAIAICTPPLSGPFCAGDCFTYPYSDIAQRFPRDYYWMYAAMAMLLVYVMVMIAIHRVAGESRKVFTLAGLAFALMSALILIVDYYIQLFVIQASLLEGETEGIALLTQFNPHGIFIALEEAGFILMSLSFLALVPVFRQYGKTGKPVMITFSLIFILTLASVIIMSMIYGIRREYRLEVIIISINWLGLIASSVLLAVFFRKHRRIEQPAE